MGIRRVLQGLFTGSAQVSESTHDAVLRLTQQVSLLGREVEELTNLVHDHHAQFNSFRGRVYAWKGRDIDLDAKKPETKQELRARLLPGFKHT